MGRQRRLLARAVALVALTAAFAASTAVFNSTYQQQAEVDARLTNGADVTVTESPGARVGPQRRRAARAGARACAASSRSSTASPTSAPTCRTSTACARTTIGAAGKLQDALVRRAAPPTQLMAHARGTARRACSSAPRRSRTSSCTPATCSACACRTARTQALHDGPVPLRGRRQGVPDRADRLVPRRQRRLRRAGDRQRRGRHVPRADRRHEPRDRRRRASARRSARRAQVTDIAEPAQGRRLEPHRRRALGPDAGRARLRARARRRRLRARARARLPRAPAHVRDRRRARRASARQLGGFVWSESAFVDRRRPAARRASLARAISDDARQGPDRRVRPAARRARGAVGLPRRGRRARRSARSRAAGVVTLRALRRPAIEELRDL